MGIRRESSDIFGHEELGAVDVNLYGPYAHGVWSSPQGKVGNEEALEGRSEAIISNFVETIRSNYSTDEIRNMTLVDVGCYDGFLTTEIEKRLPFKKIIGIEPRGKNIKKGETVRKFLGITTNIDFIETNLDGLAEGKNVFDIVFCSGVFPHLENLAISTKKLRTIAKQGIYLETQCYPDESNSILGWFLRNLHLRRIEPKDIVYNFLLKAVGIVGTKFESNYYDGSSINFSLVSLASPTHLLMLLKASNFVGERITLDPVSYRKKIRSKLRNSFYVCVFAKVLENEDAPLNKVVKKYFYDYELAHLKPVSCDRLMKKISGNWLLQYILFRQHSRLVDALIDKGVRSVFSEGDANILRNIRYNPLSKIDLELAKLEMREGNLIAARARLISRLKILNSDWRVIYRACFYLFLICKKLGQEQNTYFFKNLCLEANPSFPPDLFNIKESELLNS